MEFGNDENVFFKIENEKKFKNNIDRESYVSEKIVNKMLDYFYIENEQKKVAITLKNAYIVEAILQIDSKYKNSLKVEKKPCKNFMRYLKEKENINSKPKNKINSYGSGAFWIDCFVRIIEGEKEIEEQIGNEKFVIDLDMALKGVICAIDRENSTHLTADYVGRAKVFERLKEKYFTTEEKLNHYEKFKNNLINPGEDYELIRIIATPNKNEEYKVSIKGEEKTIKERKHFSFATKFCRYVCLSLNKKGNIPDRYYVYDKIIEKNLDAYIKEYKCSHTGFKLQDFDKKDAGKQYADFFKCLDEINELASGKKISRNAFDHIIWYFNK